jgi:hypothetical protein
MLESIKYSLCEIFARAIPKEIVQIEEDFNHLPLVVGGFFKTYCFRKLLCIREVTLLLPEVNGKIGSI